ncbi:MAG: HEAT repeat domain-containing protein [Verrucomicrobia bacterium]|nr:HEAT repeat domain-containing protein [Verrucomicrobiota bacterium]
MALHRPRGTGIRAIALLGCLWFCWQVDAAEQSVQLALKEGDRVILLGDGLIEGERSSGWIELMLTTRFPGLNVVFRNLGWSADTPAGDSRLGLSQFQAGWDPPGEGWKQLLRQLEDTKPTVVFIGYGMASSFAGEAGLAKFKADYIRLLDAIGQRSPRPRMVLIGPSPHADLGPPWPDARAHTQQLDRYNAVIREIATSRSLPFVSLFDALRTPMDSLGGGQFSENGINLGEKGYRRVAEILEDQLFARPGAWRSSPQSERLRQSIVRKNDWYHHRWRPNNFVYTFGFLKNHQGDHIRDEIVRFDDSVAAEEKRIARLRSLEPIDVPEIPRRTESIAVAPAASPRSTSSAATSVETTAYGLVKPRDFGRNTDLARPNFEVAEGLEVNLWAENPLLTKPIQMNFDPQGRLWVATSEIYPQLEPGQTAADRILVLEDTRGSGRADKQTVFADDLLIPTSVEPGDGGVYVTQNAQLIHLKDTDGDGKADQRRTILRGFGYEDGHQIVHGLRWGPDGRLYLNQSVYSRSNIETPHGLVRLSAAGIYRFDPRDERLEVLFRGWVNPWGHQFDDFGQSFVTDGAGHFGINWGMPGATYDTLAPKRRVLSSVSPGTYPKFIGIEILRSQHFPADWQGDVVTCDFRAHTVVRFKLGENGAGYVTRQMPNVVRSTDQHFRPLDVKLGPDGALYLADWSNPIIQHSGVDFREPRRDKKHGRIWKITAKGRALLPKIDFTGRKNSELFDALTSPNSYNRERARRVLLERGADAVLADLVRWATAHPEEPSQLQVVWMHRAFNRPRPDLVAGLLAAKDHRVRAAALRALPANATLAQLIPLIADPHPRVRLEAVRALGKIGSARAAELALTVLEQPMDPFLDYALWLTINELATPWLAAVKSGAWQPEGREKQLEFALKAVEPALASEVLAQLLENKVLPRDGAGPWIELIGTAGGARELRRLFDHVLAGGFDDRTTPRALAALGDAARLRRTKPEGDLAALGSLLDGKNEPVRIATIQLVEAWKLAKFSPRLVQIAGGAETSARERVSAFAALRAIGGTAVGADLARLAREASRPQIRGEAVVTLAALNLEAALDDVIAVLRLTTDPAEAQSLWRALLGIRGAGEKLAAKLTQASLPPEVAQAGLRPAREGSQNQALVEALMKIAGLTLANVQLSPAELQSFAQEAIAKGDAARGERIYRRAELACLACHAIGGAGGKVGPDLTSIGASAQPDYLLESLLYPNAKLKQGYHTELITTKDQQMSGMVVRENANEVVVRNASDREVSIPVKEITQRTSVGSLMPAGLLDTLLPEERLDLVKFLSVLGKPGEYDAAKGGVARAWKIYPVSSRLQLVPMEQLIHGDFTLPDWMPAFSLANGALPKDVFETAVPKWSATIRGLFAATQFHSAKGGPATFRLNADAKGLWVNGEPVKRGEQFSAPTKPGLNTIVVQLHELDFSRIPEAMKLTSDDVAFLSN